MAPFSFGQAPRFQYRDSNDAVTPQFVTRARTSVLSGQVGCLPASTRARWLALRSRKHCFLWSRTPRHQTDINLGMTWGFPTSALHEYVELAASEAEMLTSSGPIERLPNGPKCPCAPHRARPRAGRQSWPYAIAGERTSGQAKPDTASAPHYPIQAKAPSKHETCPLNPGSLLDLDCMMAAPTSASVHFGSLIRNGTFLPACSPGLLPFLVISFGLAELLFGSTGFEGTGKKELRRRSAFSLSSITLVSPSSSTGAP